ncbi:MAG: ABC transporter ATP-binding protein [Clostridiales Family XIII bacterium]|jgi:osmoprotectant transport system ATP-binding protein|nr:ABC transporter ATP-binding protein [Clostridiales Family XIII bacterium]
MSKIAIEFKNVYKKFDGSDRYSVENVSLQIESGAFVTILGSSGCGKTTLLKLINRLYDATSGEIYCFGESVSELEPNAHRRGIGYVIQQTGLFPHKTVEQNISVVPKLLGWPEERKRNRVTELLRLVGLFPEAYRKRYPSKLSGGEQQRVGLARALAAGPSLLLMDEPFGAIDAITRRELQDEILRIKRETNATVVFVTHDVQEAFKLGDSVVVMHEGRVQQHASPYEIMLNPANAFVASLINSGNIFEKLKVMRVDGILESYEGVPNDAVSLRLGTSLADLLQAFISENVERINILDETGAIAGGVSFDNLRRMVGRSESHDYVI